MLKDLLKNNKFSSSIKNFYKENKNKILDVLLFGSAVKGKEKPTDIDLLIVYKTEKEDSETSHDLRVLLKKQGFNVSITSKTYISLFNPAFIAREVFLSEAYSFVLNNSISRGLGYEPLMLFRYELKGMSKSDRMRFYYSLYGRKESTGILENFKARKFSDTIIASPIENAEKMKEFLQYWKIEFMEIPALVPSRILEAKNL